LDFILESVRLTKSPPMTAACRACGENLAGGLFCRSCVKRQDGYGDGAEAVMEEVTALEEALQQTVARSEGPKYDNAVTTYGIQLRAWVDMQVDARLGQLLPSFLEGEFETFRSEYASAQEVASTRLEGELQAVADAQAKLLQVVDSMSRELTRVKEERTSRESWDMGQELLRVKDQVSALDRQLQNWRSEASMEEGSLKDLNTWAERKFSAESQRIAGLERELSTAEARLNAQLQELNSEASRSKLEVESKLNILRNDLETRLDAQLARFRDQPSPARELELKLRSLRMELEGKVISTYEAKIQSLEDRIESRLVGFGSEMEEKLESYIGDRLESLRKDCQEDAKSYFQDLETRLGNDVAALEQRLISELREEATLALNRESAAIAALDEQLWITDQRLGQRIDELASTRVRERGSAKNGRVLSSILSETLEDARQEMPLVEPTTQEAADYRAKRVTGSVFAAAQKAAKSMIEECRDEGPRTDGLRAWSRSRETVSSTPHLRAFEDEGPGRLRSSRRGIGALGMASKAAETFASHAR
ncbi:unnamed protein product, partial [Durusdinium trenchii]